MNGIVAKIENKIKEQASFFELFEKIKVKHTLLKD